MSRAAHVLRWIASRVMDAQTLERVFDAAVADVWFEHARAVAAPPLWRWWILARGYVGVVKLLVIHPLGATLDVLTALDDDDRRALVRLARVIAGVLVTITTLLVLPPAMKWVQNGDASLVAYLIPHALPLSVPIALLAGVAAIRRCGRGSRAWISITALLLSVASFGILGWVMPNANQAFRVAVAGRHLPKGINELTLPELRSAMTTGDTAATLTAGRPDRLPLLYHQRLMIAVAPLMFAILGLSLVGRGYVWRIWLSVLATTAYAALTLWAPDIQAGAAVAPAVAAWLPNAFIGVMAVSVWRMAPTHERHEGRL